MRLHLECVDWPDREKHYQPEWIQAENKTFQTERVPIDNHQYGKCVFEDCTFVYSGGPFGFSECELKGSCRLVVTGAARRALDCLQAFEPYLRQAATRF
jgi:hypothetical protein